MRNTKSIITNEIPKTYIIKSPSQNNLKSAEFLKIDWSDYKENIVGFINEICGMIDDILITSPNDFAYAKEILVKL